MHQDIGFDVISDLNLNPNDSFNWENKASSLYCILAGNVSSNLRTVTQVLLHLAKYYQGIFYVPGELEYKNSDDISERTNELIALCDRYESVISTLEERLKKMEAAFVEIVNVPLWDEYRCIEIARRALKEYRDELHAKRDKNTA